MQEGTESPSWKGRGRGAPCSSHTKMETS